MGFGAPPTSPMVYETFEIVYGVDQDQAVTVTTYVFSVTVFYDNATKALTTPAVAHRDAGCSYAAFLIAPSTADQVSIPVPVGDTSIDLTAYGITTETQLENLGYTAA